MRLFVAAWPPPEVLDVLEAIERPSLPGVRWTTRPQWHVTLRFLGEVGEPEVDDVVAALAGAAASLSLLRAELAGRLGHFRRTVLHVGVAGLEPWAAVVGGLELPGQAPSGRPFVGHVTLARSRRPSPALASLAASTPVPAGARAWAASELTLVRSTPGPGGSTYERLFAITLV